MTKPYICIEKINESFLKLDSDDVGILRELYDYYSFYAQGYRFNPSYQSHLWDGKIHLVNPKKMTTLLGLRYSIQEFCQKRDYDFFDKSSTDEEVEDISTLDSFIESLKLPFTPRDYQLDAIKYALKNQKCVLLSPTGSGKSLIQYIILRWHFAHNRKICLVVPTISLVEQMLNDFRNYSKDDDSFDVDKLCTPLYGKKKNDPFEANILISTWQSIKNFDKSLFQTWDAVMIDECHGASANCLKKILEGAINAKVKIGATGSLSGEEIHEYLLSGLFGKIYQVTTTKDLQNNGTLSQLRIYFVTLQHTKERVKKFYNTYGTTIETENGTKVLQKPTYADEVEFLTTDEKRQLFVRNIALSCKGVVLVLFNRIEQGKDLYEKIKAKSGEREVFYIAGEVSADEREKIRNIIRAGKGAILVASVGTCSTGIDIPSIENVILCPSKSRIRNLQSIGRGLRIDKDKNSCTIIDIVDSFSSYRRHKSYSVKHAAVRYGIYEEQKFPIKFQTIENF